MLDKLNLKRDKIVDIQKALQTADINQDKQLDFDEWRQDLKTSVLSILIISQKYYFSNILFSKKLYFLKKNYIFYQYYFPIIIILY